MTLCKGMLHAMPPSIEGMAAHYGCGQPHPVSGDEANLVKDWGGRLVAKAGGSKGHALHNSSWGEGHPVGDISHRPDVVHSRPGVRVYLDGLVLI